MSVPSGYERWALQAHRFVRFSGCGGKVKNKVPQLGVT